MRRTLTPGDLSATSGAVTDTASALRDVALVFLKLGTIAFGGPAAHIAMLEDEVVRRRKWLTHEQFLDYLGAVNLIPGPNSTELAIHIGYARAGWPGLLVAGICFILPAAVIVSVIAWAYVRFGTLPAAAALLYGVKPVVIAVVVQALWRLGRTALKGPALVALGVAAVVASALGVHELVVLGASAAVMAFAGGGARQASGGFGAATLGTGCRRAPSEWRVWDVAAAAGSAGAATAATPVTLGALFGSFVKIGAVLFGGGYVLLAFLRADLVERLGWLTERQLLDAVAVGQMTPGPVFTTATFVGYLIAGRAGAVVATVGIFLPAFVFVALSGWLVPKLRRSSKAGATLDGVNVASLALMAVVTWQLGRAALVDWLSVLIALTSWVLLVRFRVNSAWLVLAGAGVGLVAGRWLNL
jgi:chromate transporter